MTTINLDQYRNNPEYEVIQNPDGTEIIQKRPVEYVSREKTYSGGQKEQEKRSYSEHIIRVEKDRIIEERPKVYAHDLKGRDHVYKIYSPTIKEYSKANNALIKEETQTIVSGNPRKSGEYNYSAETGQMIKKQDIDRDVQGRTSKAYLKGGYYYNNPEKAPDPSRLPPEVRPKPKLTPQQELELKQKEFQQELYGNILYKQTRTAQMAATPPPEWAFKQAEEEFRKDPMLLEVRYQEGSNIYKFKRKPGSQAAQLKAESEPKMLGGLVEPAEKKEGYSGFMQDLRQKLGEAEIRAVRSSEFGKAEFYRVLSAALEPISSVEDLKRTATTAAVSFAAGAGLTALGMATGPIGPTILLGAGGIYAATKVDDIQEGFAQAQIQGPQVYKEKVADFIGQMGVGTAAAYAGASAVTGGVQAYKEYRFNKITETKGNYEWDIDVIEGKRQYGLQTEKGTQMQLYPKDVKTTMPEQQPLQIQKGAYPDRIETITESRPKLWAVQEPGVQTKFVAGESAMQVVKSGKVQYGTTYGEMPRVPHQLTVGEKAARIITEGVKLPARLLFGGVTTESGLTTTQKPSVDYESIWGTGEASGLEIPTTEVAISEYTPTVYDKYGAPVPMLATEQIPITETTIKPKVTPIEITGSTQLPIQDIALDLGPAVETVAVQKQTPVSSSVTSYLQIPETVTEPEPLPEPTPIEEPTAPTPFFEIQEPVTPPPEYLETPNWGFGPKQRGKFDILVRRKGTFKKIGTAPTPEEAFKIGAKKVKQTAAASFKIEGPGSQFGRKVLSPVEFRESRKEPGVFIQKRRFRISSPGEKREITFKGIATRKAGKKRSVFGGLFK